MGASVNRERDSARSLYDHFSAPRDAGFAPLGCRFSFPTHIKTTPQGFASPHQAVKTFNGRDALLRVR